MLNEREIQLLDHKINQRGIRIDFQLVEACIALSEQLNERYNAELAQLTKGAVTSTAQVVKLLEYINRYLEIPMPNLQKTTIRDWLQMGMDDFPRNLIELRILNSNTAVKKYPAMKLRACDDGRIRNNLLYYGAHTGRWSAKGVQVQNLFRPQIDRRILENIAIPLVLNGDLETIEALFGSPVEVLASLVRSCLIAAPGHRLMGGDFSSVEARGVFWLSRDQQGLADFEADIDIYSRMAAKLNQCPVVEVTKSQRFIGKTAILGAQYQLSGKGLKRNCKNKYDIELEESFANRAIHEYRTRYSAVPKFWYAMNTAAIRGAGKVNRLRWSIQDDFLRLHMPAGGCIHYPYPEIHPNQFDAPGVTYMGLDDKKKWTRLDAYGGSLTENAAQRFCRDIMAAAMIRCEKAGYHIVLTAHDEIVAEVPNNFGSLEEFRNLLIERPSWAVDFPVEVKTTDCWEGQRYRKG